MRRSHHRLAVRGLVLASLALGCGEVTPTNLPPTDVPVLPDVVSPSDAPVGNDVIAPFDAPAPPDDAPLTDPDVPVSPPDVPSPPTDVPPPSDVPVGPDVPPTGGRCTFSFDCANDPAGRVCYRAIGEIEGRCVECIPGTFCDDGTTVCSRSGRCSTTCADDNDCATSADGDYCDTASGACMHVLAGHEGEVSKAAFNPQGTRAVTAHISS